jgi:hypothetical protein
MTIAAFENNKKSTDCFFNGTSGQSEAASLIFNQATESLIRLFDSSISRVNEKNDIESAKTKLLSVANLAKTTNWDGYGAKSVSTKTIIKTIQFLNRLSEKQRLLCEFAPEPDGEMAIEWYAGKNNVFAISIGEEDKINFAGLYSNGSKINGVINSYEEDIQIIHQYIDKAISK